MKPDPRQLYLARMRRVLDHVDAHPDADLSVDALAGIAAFSPFHFHRQFAATFGISVHRYVQLARLERASHALAYREAPVTDIALDSGYAGPEAFARAFRQRIGQSPSDFRRAPDWTPLAAATAPLDQARSIAMTTDFTDADVTILDFAETPIACRAHRGDPARIGDTIRDFIAWRRAAGLPPAKARTFNLLHNDPEITAPKDYRIDICVEVRGAIPHAEGIEGATIPAGRCARLRLTGSSDNLRPAVQFLYADWLPRSGEELRDFPVFAERVRFFPDVAENAAITDIYLPLRTD